MGHTAAVLGASGFSGGEVVRLLAGHPEIELCVAGAGDRAGRPLAETNPALAGVSDDVLVPVDEAVEADTDLCLSCLPPGALSERVDRIRARVVIDLSDENRAVPSWVYGLTEFARSSLTGATRVANPGCYPTAMLLALVPFAAEALVTGPIVVDAVSGTSGAGRSAQDRLSHAVVAGGAGAYGSVHHRHVPEMERALGAFGNLAGVVSFTPHLVPMARGLVATVRAPLAGDLADAEPLEVLAEAYAGEPFVRVLPEWPSTKSVAGSNRALVTARVDARASFLVASCAIDNLGKGAAGQAIQNANVVLGLKEDCGLGAVGMWP